MHALAWWRRAALLACTPLVVACGKSTAPTGKPDASPQAIGQPGVDETPIVPTSAPCDSLTRLECLGSTHCTLHWIKTGEYECRPDEGPCETSLSQLDKKGCLAVPGCLFKEAACYCPFPGYGQTKVPDKGQKGGACACGGGAPSLCFLGGGARPDAGAAAPDAGADAGTRPPATDAGR